MTDHYEMDDNSPDDGEKDESSMTSAVLPKSILAGKKFDVGDEVVLKITGMNEDEITVEYATGDEESPEEDAGESGEEPGEEPAMASDGGEDGSHY